MVEMDMPDASRLQEWHAWYRQHLVKLLSVRGFLSAQRFQALTASAAPFVAIYSITDADVITSAEYRAKAGPDSTGEWRHRMTNWKRNLLQGMECAPRVPLDGWLAIIDRESNDAPPLPPEFHALRPVGLDCSMVERVLLAGAPPDAPPVPHIERGWQLRSCKPLTPVMTPGFRV
jgi:hypothetical protein